MTSNNYLIQVLNKYQAKNLSLYLVQISSLKAILQNWASSCFIEILESGSRAKGTAIHLASDVDYLVSLTSGCNENNGGLSNIYNSLHAELQNHYTNVRKQNVSFRILLLDLEVDIAPARKYSGNTNYHSLYISKKDTWQQTNIQKHINDVSQSGRMNEIKLLKIWRELNQLDFPSIYMEYLIINNILYNKSTNLDNLADNFHYVLSELSKNTNNPLFSRIVDSSNSNNILSDLLSITEKNDIVHKAKIAVSKEYWRDIIW